MIGAWAGLFQRAVVNSSAWEEGKEFTTIHRKSVVPQVCRRNFGRVPQALIRIQDLPRQTYERVLGSQLFFFSNFFSLLSFVSFAVVSFGASFDSVLSVFSAEASLPPLFPA